MNKIILIAVSIFCIYNCNAQQGLDSLSKKILQSDSIWVIDFSRMTEREKVSESIRLGIFDSIKSKILTKLNHKNTIRFSAIIKKNSPFKGRYAALGGFTAGQGILIWSNGKFSYFETCLPCHRLKIYTSFESHIVNFNPNKKDDIENFFLKLGIIKRINRTIYL